MKHFLYHVHHLMINSSSFCADLLVKTSLIHLKMENVEHSIQKDFLVYEFPGWTNHQVNLYSSKLIFMWTSVSPKKVGGKPLQIKHKNQVALIFSQGEQTILPIQVLANKFHFVMYSWHQWNPNKTQIPRNFMSPWPLSINDNHWRLFSRYNNF